MKVYIIAYCLTEGIEEKEIKKQNIDSNGIISIYHSKTDEYEYLNKNDWRENLEEAKKEAEKMKEEEIKRLQKQIEKIKKLKF